ncbi:MAG: hypothetical protein K1W05_09340 [Desulfovibrio sp.]
MATKVFGIRCNDRTPEDGHFGGWATWEKLMESMERQKRLPFEKRIRPCLKFNDWWIIQAQGCVKCEKAIWDLFISGERQVAKMTVVNGKTVELVCRETGEIFTYTIGRGFE